MIKISIEELTERQKYQLWRKINKIKLVTVSEAIGMSVSSLSRWENGLRDLDDSIIKKYDFFISAFEQKKKGD